MPIKPTSSQTHNLSHTDSCCSSKKSPCFVVAERITAIALGIFSAYVNIKLFLPAFLIGMTIGAYSHITNARNSGSSCTNGLLEQLTGVKLPAPISLAANVAVTICHIDHHASVFVPIIGVSLGAWAGKNASYYGSLAYKNIEPYFHTEPKAAMA